MDNPTKYRLVEEDYDSVSLDYHNSYDPAKEFKQFIDSFVARLPQNASVLNVGGIAGECRYFHDHNLKVTDIDISQAILDYISENEPRTITIKANIRDPLLGTYDGIWACRSLIHVPPTELGMVLNNIATLLAENGVAGLILFTTQLEEPEEQSLPEPYTDKKDVVYYRALYSQQYLSKCITEAGLKITRQEIGFDKDNEEVVYFELIK